MAFGISNGAQSHEEWVANGVWARGEGYGHAIVGDLLAGSSGWIDWHVSPIISWHLP